MDISLSDLISVWLGLNHREKLRVYSFNFLEPACIIQVETNSVLTLLPTERMKAPGCLTMALKMSPVKPSCHRL